MIKLKIRVFFYDAQDVDSGEFYSLQEAMAEDFVRAEDDELVPTDECSVIVYYTGEFMSGYDLENWLQRLQDKIVHKKDELFTPVAMHGKIESKKD